jgi:hypothetical protein
MDLFDGLVGAFRRWYVLLPILAVTAAVTLVVYDDKTTEYSSSATIGVTTSSTSVQQPVPSGSPSVARSNALLANGGVNLVTNLLTIGLRSTLVKQEIVAAKGTLAYSTTITQPTSNGSQLPILIVSARGVNANQVSTTMSVLLRQAGTVLARVQSNAGIPSDKFARTYVVEPASRPGRATLDTKRNAGVVIAVGVLLAFVFAAGFDNVVNRRGRRGRPRHVDRGAEPDSDPGPGPGPGPGETYRERASSTANGTAEHR